MSEHYCEAIGDENQLYQSEKYAKAQGLPAIPLPPTMPVIMYKFVTIPWKQDGVMIHRKQKCTTLQRMFIGREYTAHLVLTDVTSRRAYTFQKEILLIHDSFGNLCFEGISHIVLGEER